MDYKLVMEALSRIDGTAIVNSLPMILLGAIATGFGSIVKDKIQEVQLERAVEAVLNSRNLM